jgi:hypothetical protein
MAATLRRSMIFPRINDSILFPSCMVRMPREGLSETGQIIAAVATAIILALLAKYGFLPDEDDGKKESEDTGKTTVINIQIGTQEIEKAARDGRDAMTPVKGTPPRTNNSGYELIEAPFDELDVGALPIKNRAKDIMPNIGAQIRDHVAFYSLVVVLDSMYKSQAKIGVYSDGFAGLAGDGWSKLEVEGLGVFQDCLHFLVAVPVNWDAKDASGRVKRLVVLSRTENATKVPDSFKCINYLERARNEGTEKYRLEANHPLHLFSRDTGRRAGSASLQTIDKSTAQTHVLAIYIPRGTHEIFSEP